METKLFLAFVVTLRARLPQCNSQLSVPEKMVYIGGESSENITWTPGISVNTLIRPLGTELAGNSKLGLYGIKLRALLVLAHMMRTMCPKERNRLGMLRILIIVCKIGMKLG